MSLIYPHSAVNVAERNLNHLLTLGKPGRHGPEHVATKVALEAFEDHQNANLGLLHQAKKFTASTLAYGTAIGAPVALVGTAAYYLLKPYYNDPTLIFQQAAGYGLGDGSGSTALALIGPNGLVSTTAAVTTVIGLAATDYTFYKAIGYRPVLAVGKWSVNMLSSALLYSAYKAGELTTNSYAQVEADAANKRKNCHETILHQGKVTYDDMAQDLIVKCHEALDSPKDILELKNTIKQLYSNMPLVRHELSKLGLQPSEVSLILDKLLTVMRNISEVQFSLRNAGSDADSKYNAQLLSILDVDDLEEQAISPRAQHHLDEVKANSLGVMHTIKSYVNSTTAGTATTLATGLAIPAIAAAANYTIAAASYALESPLYTQAIAQLPGMENAGVLAASVAVVAGTAIYAGAKVFNRYSQSYTKERTDADAAVIKNTQAAELELAALYDGMASYLMKQQKLAGTNAKVAADLKETATNIKAKMPAIEAQISATRVITDSKTITKQLEAALENVLKAPVAMPARQPLQKTRVRSTAFAA